MSSFTFLGSVKKRVKADSGPPTFLENLRCESALISNLLSIPAVQISYSLSHFIYFALNIQKLQ